MTLIPMNLIHPKPSNQPGIPHCYSYRVYIDPFTQSFYATPAHMKFPTWIWTGQTLNEVKNMTNKKILILQMTQENLDEIQSICSRVLQGIALKP